MQAVTRGIDALGEVTIRVTSEDGRVFTGRGAHSDIIVASAKAYTNALNRLLVSSVTTPTVTIRHEERSETPMPRPMTITEKILAAHAGLDEVEPGQLINCRLDLVLANDVTAPIAIREFAQDRRRARSGTREGSRSCPTTTRRTRTSSPPSRPR